ncbi:transporter [Komagataeibacter nataicola]|uniref:Transporter n=1 Tax=Komagataeibacter nataicola TaxID=265960 RepID=A0A9N7CNQ4_9PROT|nr:gluconate:H+ symporter [Komagataeibacter nataicola]AQU87889.1 transporter [Komagataeibacter nataicola]PYD66449.1 transporter [Komagataeibacter nataicola]WEQ55630.1 gluconate:H+ symporter [Komagataeibacter nataicola]WNM09499.1 gluconate:H+ symporter [Komagataeibacter nataicola]GBR26502.1 gluconate permease [Komagataeibacter nataicola NRIC 0616]
MTPLALILTGIGSIAVLLLLILKLRLHPFVALLVVAVVVALLTGMPVAKLADAIQGSMGRIMGHIAIIVAFGAMIGRMVDLSGGAATVANALIGRVGRAHVPLALVIAAFGVGIPVFFEVGVIMLMPLVYGMARQTGRVPAVFGIPMAVTMLTVHALLPPHPGAVAVAAALGVGAGHMLLLGLPLAAVATVLTYVLTRPIMAQPLGCAPDIRAVVDEARVPAHGQGEGDGAAAAFMQATARSPVGVGEVLTVIAMPVVLMVAGTLAGELMAPGRVRTVMVFAGIPFVALGLDVLLCAWLLGLRRGMALAIVSDVVAAALPGTAIIILITGAGGAFAQVLVGSGVGDALGGLLASTGLPLLVLAFVLTMILRVAQGPTTVALMTTAGILGPMIGRLHLDQTHLALMALAMGAGGMALSHVNDAGFWIVTRLCGVSVREGLRSWSLMTLVAALLVFAGVAALWGVMPASRG